VQSRRTRIILHADNLRLHSKRRVESLGVPGSDGQPHCPKIRALRKPGSSGPPRCGSIVAHRHHPATDAAALAVRHCKLRLHS